MTMSSSARIERRLEVQYQKIGDLKPYAGNARKHSKRQVRQLAKSMDMFGFTQPILINEDMMVLAGHGRLEAAQLRGMTEVPTIMLPDMSEAETRAYILADNRLAELATWDDNQLGIELNLLVEINFEFEATGFDTPDVDRLFSNTPPAEERVNLPEPDAPAVSRLGDLWAIGEHRILCADSQEAASFDRLLDGERAQMVFTDPPFNVSMRRYASGHGGAKLHREFEMASGDMTEAQFTYFLTIVLKHAAAFSLSGSIHYVCIDWKHMGEMLAAGRVAYTELKNLAVWAKTNFGLGSFYRSQHELVFVFKSGTGKHINNFGMGAKGRTRSNLWTYAGANGFRKGRREDLGDHPTVKPVQMVADAILDCSKPNGLILDAFCGSGSTLLAAEQTKRRGYAIEIDAAYVDVAIRRLEKATGQEARLDTGETFAMVAKRRLAEKEDE
jgi:DNA modification methylase